MFSAQASRNLPTDLVVEIQVDGGKYTFIITSANFTRTIVLEDGKQTEYPAFSEGTLKVCINFKQLNKM